jgi:glycosyltransferase involved in cell wall biosynthesis
MASGLPIIATHQSGATTLMKDGVEGFVIRERNIDELAEKMIRIAVDRELNEKMGRAAAFRGTEKNSWEDYAERVTKICAGFLERKRR